MIETYTMSEIMMGCVIDDTVIVDTIEFAAPFQRKAMQGAENNAQLTLPRGMTLHDLTVRHGNAQATLVQTVTVNLDTVNTSLTVDIPLAAAGNVQDTTNHVHANAGQELSVQFDSPATSTAAAVLSFTMMATLDG